MSGEFTTPAVMPYDILGGEQKVRSLVNRVYDLMDEVPEYYGIR